MHNDSSAGLVQADAITMKNLLFMPQDCVKASTMEMDRLIHSRDLFITRQCGDTHVGCAMSQIKKARGQNKWVNQPKTPISPTKEEFCYVKKPRVVRQTERL